MYSSLIKIKMLILQHGVSFSSTDAFTNRDSALRMKTKIIESKPIVKNNKVFEGFDCKTVIPSEIILFDNDCNQTLVKLRYSVHSIVKAEVFDDQFNMRISIDDLNMKCYATPVFDISHLDTPITDPSFSGVIFPKDYLSVVGLDRISVLFFEGCQNWSIGQPCKFCNYHAKKEDDISLIPSINELGEYEMDLDKWWSDKSKHYLPGLKIALKYILECPSITPHKHLFFMAGGMIDNDFLWSIVKNTILFLKNDIDFSKYDTIVNVQPHNDTNNLISLKMSGIKQIQYNIEVMDSILFSEYCPQKLSFCTFKKKMKEAVNIMGHGNVRCNLVFGLQDLKGSIEGANELASMGVVPDFSVFQPKKNTKLSGLLAPHFDDILFFANHIVTLYFRYGYKPIFCSLSSRSSIVNELYYSRGARL